ncbi:MAG: large repetitive protein, partial [Acidimicrobiaceae bacterium]
MSMFVSRSRRFGLGSVIAVVVALVTQIGSASAAAVHCGDVIRRSVTLTTDVGPCSGNGVIVGADNVKIDLGGHRVLGSADRSDDRIGILLPRRHGVTITHGTVTGFSAGIAIEGGAANTLTNLVVRDNVGPALREADFGDGILIDGSAHNRVTASSIGPGNGPFDGIAILDAGADFNQIGQNVIQGNDVDAPLVPGDTGPFNFDEGIFLTPSTLDATLVGNSITGNVIRNNGANGINVFESVQRTTISGNAIDGNGFGAAAALNQGVSGLGLEEEGIFFNSGAGTSTVEANTVRDNADGGILLAGCCGNPVTDVSGHNRVLDNVATGNKALNGFPDLYDSFAFSEDAPGRCGTDVWRGNTWGAYPGT